MDLSENILSQTKSFFDAQRLKESYFDLKSKDPSNKLLEFYTLNDEGNLNLTTDKFLFEAFLKKYDAPNIIDINTRCHKILQHYVCDITGQLLRYKVDVLSQEVIAPKWF